MKVTNIALAYILKYKKDYVIGVLTSILITLVSVFLLLQIEVIIERHIPNQDFGAIVTISILIAGLVLTNAVLKFVNMSCFNRASLGLQYDVRRGIFSHLLKIRYNLFNKKSFGELNTTVINDVGEFSSILNNLITTSFTAILYWIVVFIILLSRNILLTLILFVFISVFYILINKLKKTFVRFAEQYTEARSKLNVTIDEAISSTETITLYGLQRHFVEKVRADNVDLKKKWLSWNITIPTIYSSIELAILVSYLLVIILGARMVTAGHLTYGELVLYIVFMPQLWERFSSVLELFSSLARLKVYAKRTFSTFALEEHEQDINEKNVLSLSEHTLEFKDVCFGYENEKTLFTDFNTRFDSNSLTIITGKSGRGKSTLFDLVLRLYDIRKGEISIGGESINDLSLDQLRSIVGIVHQDSQIIEGDVFENIRLGDTSITDETIIETIERYNFSFAFSDYGAKEFSTGQKRIISLIRMMLRNPEIILLDEITTNLDSYTEEVIYKFISEITKTKICLFISHFAIDNMTIGDYKILHID